MAKNQPGVRIDIDESYQEYPFNTAGVDTSKWTPEDFDNNIKYVGDAERFGFANPQDVAEKKWEAEQRILKAKRDFAEANSRSWPTAIANPQAAVDMIVANYGKNKRDMLSTETDMNYLRQYFPDRFGGGLTNGFLANQDGDPFWTKDEYDVLMDAATGAFNGDGDSAEYLNRIIADSQKAFQARKKRK